MRRVWMILLSLLVFTVPARAAEEKWVALTFDDGPSGALTEQLLDGLSARSIHATFFVCGYRVAQYPAALRRIAADGHEIGLHSDKHDYMQHMTFAEVTDDLTRCQAAVFDCCGARQVVEPEEIHGVAVDLRHGDAFAVLLRAAQNRQRAHLLIVAQVAVQTFGRLIERVRIEQLRQLGAVLFDLRVGQRALFRANLRA